MKLGKVRCPYCCKRVVLTSTGKLYSHLDPATKRKCGRSGGSPS